MSKCGKNSFPECEYFTTAGCISPFNCPYKVEDRYSNNVFTTGVFGKIKDYFQSLVQKGIIPQEPANYDAATLKIYIDHLESENAALRERLEKAETKIDEYENKIEYGKLVDPVWFISFMNDLPCYGRVIGYQEDSGFVMECTDCMISAKEIYFSEEETLARLAELKGGKE